MKKIVLTVPKVKGRITPPSELVVTKIHNSAKDHRRHKLSIRNVKPEDIDSFDDKFYE